MKTGKLIINYRDDGTGFETDAKTEGLGFTTMSKRMQEINSDIRINSIPGSGMHAILYLHIADQKPFK
jgi:signal transduction histidine kinase